MKALPYLFHFLNLPEPALSKDEKEEVMIKEPKRNVVTAMVMWKVRLPS